MELSKALSIMFTGFTVVFLALILLIFIMWLMGKMAVRADARKNIKKNSCTEPETAVSGVNDNEETEKVIAAITAAVTEYDRSTADEDIPAVPDKPDVSSNRWGFCGLMDSTEPF